MKFMSSYCAPDTTWQLQISREESEPPPPFLSLSLSLFASSGWFCVTLGLKVSGVVESQSQFRSCSHTPGLVSQHTGELKISSVPYSDSYDHPPQPHLWAETKRAETHINKDWANDRGYFGSYNLRGHSRIFAVSFPWPQNTNKGAPQNSFNPLCRVVLQVTKLNCI